MDNLENRCGPVSRGHISYPFRMRGGCKVMMDNSCKSVDGMMYKISPRIADDDILADDLKDRDINFALLIWSDFAGSHSNDHVVLKDRDI